jgi:hypothetical protein
MKKTKLRIAPWVYITVHSSSIDSSKTIDMLLRDISCSYQESELVYTPTSDRVFRTPIYNLKNIIDRLDMAYQKYSCKVVWEPYEGDNNAYFELTRDFGSAFTDIASQLNIPANCNCIIFDGLSVNY